MKNNNTTETTREFSKETSLLIESLEYVLKAEGLALGAYLEEYGDPEGQTLWQDSDIKDSIEDLKQDIKTAIGDFMECNMGETNYKKI